MLTNKLKILVVDDEADIAELIGFNLEMAGVEAITTLSVDEAIKQISLNNFTAVISDMRMPKKTGIDLLKHIQDSCPQLPVFFYTGFSETEDMELKNLGAKEVFHKPTDLKSMVQYITNVKWEVA